MRVFRFGSSLFSTPWDFSQRHCSPTPLIFLAASSVDKRLYMEIPERLGETERSDNSERG